LSAEPTVFYDTDDTQASALMVSQVYRLVGDVEQRMASGALRKLMVENGERRHTHFNLYSDAQVGANLELVSGHLVRTHGDEDCETDSETLARSTRICDNDLEKLTRQLAHQGFEGTLKHHTYNYRRFQSSRFV